MANVTVTIDFQKRSTEVDGWIKRNRLDRDSLDELHCVAKVNIAEIGDADIDAEYERRFPADEDAVTRAYRYLGEGDITAAMDELHAAFPQLRTPHDERRMADLLSRPVKGGANG